MSLTVGEIWWAFFGKCGHTFFPVSLRQVSNSQEFKKRYRLKEMFYN
jgi:hypothetical protein